MISISTEHDVHAPSLLTWLVASQRSKHTAPRREMALIFGSQTTQQKQKKIKNKAPENTSPTKFPIHLLHQHNDRDFQFHFPSRSLFSASQPGLLSAPTLFPKRFGTKTVVTLHGSLPHPSVCKQLQQAPNPGPLDMPVGYQKNGSCATSRKQDLTSLDTFLHSCPFPRVNQLFFRHL